MNQPLNKYKPLQPSALPRGPWIKGAVDTVGSIGGKFLIFFLRNTKYLKGAHINEELIDIREENNGS